MKIGAVIAFAIIASAAAQDGTSPTFRAGTKLVDVDVVAKRKGQPATGLTKEDFTLTDNGRRQNIAFFSIHSAKAAHNAEAPPPAGTYSNRLAHGSDSAGRTTVILFDQMNTPQQLQGYVIPRIAKFAQSQRGDDRLAIYTLPSRGGVHVVQDLTGDPQLLKRAAASLKAQTPDPRFPDTAGMSQHEAASYQSISFMGPCWAFRDAAKEISRHLAGVPGRKHLVWVTTAFPLYVLELAIDCRPEMEQASRALNNANIALYAVDARALMGALEGLTAITPAEAPGPPPSPRIVNMLMQRGEPLRPRGLDTEQMVAGLTGGETFFNKSNAIEETIQTAVEDGDITYTLGFYPDQSTQNEKWHDLKVAVASRGIELRYRTSYFAGRDGELRNDSPRLDQILKESLDSARIEIKAEARPDPARPSVLNLKINIDLHDVAFARANGQRSGTVDLSFYVEGTRHVFNKPLQIEIPDDQFDAVLNKGLDAVAPIDITGGVDALRIVVQDKTTGASGSITVPLPAR
jgi:VWFA-related protein